MLESTCHLPPDFDCWHPHEFSTRSDTRRKLGYEYLRLARSDERIISDDQAGVHWTHAENMKNPVEVRLPTDNRLLVIPRMKKSRDCVTSALLDDLPLYFRDSPVIQNMVGRTRNRYIAGSTHAINWFIASHTD